MQEKAQSNWYGKIIFPPMNSVSRYLVSNTILLTCVPLFCGTILIILLFVFSKLNLYYLESNGLLLNDAVRDAYYSNVIMEVFSVIGFFILQLVATIFVSFVVMRWSTAPFSQAKKTIETAMKDPERLKPPLRFLSESPSFDQLIWNFCLRIKTKQPFEKQSSNSIVGINPFFFLKFIATYGILSLTIGYVLGILLNEVYGKIVNLALQLIPQKNASLQHYFIAQQEVLDDATFFMTGMAMVIYLFMGFRISRYMATMIFVFYRAIAEDHLPIVLRTTDIYHDFSETVNKGRAQLK
ncbi:MAG: hypothetical protein M9962_14115 [Oligoflexia bacterium]|nr:hypothetical protein [Oligoflexia bacterium]